jgi:RimJ/RimL family protein N-acetyltransferase
MTAWVEPVVLEGERVRLEPLTEAHVDDLMLVAMDPTLWRWTLARPTDRDGLLAWVMAAVANHEQGLEMPFATIDRASGRAVGSSRYMSIVPDHRRLEIGWTWLGSAYHRGGANKEAKYLQLRHAFETLGANRVEFKTDSLNERANPALLGIGATFEGAFRDHMIMPEGRLRTSNYYSIIAPEWPTVKARLEAAMGRGESR